MKKAAVLWTGGKDCALAFLKAKQAGYDISYLVTFAPENPDFKAHNLALIQQQVKAIGLPHLLVTVKPPMQKSYENIIKNLKTQHQITTLITGDIDEVSNHDNWIEKCAKKSDVSVFNPLWKKDRNQLLNELLEHEFNVVFSLVKKPFFDKTWLGKTIKPSTIQKLKKLNIDICGENGEYHTMVTNAPYFINEIVLEDFKKEETKNYFYLKNNHKV